MWKQAGRERTVAEVNAWAAQHGVPSTVTGTAGRGVRQGWQPDPAVPDRVRMALPLLLVPLVVGAVRTLRATGRADRYWQTVRAGVQAEQTRVATGLPGRPYPVTVDDVDRPSGVLSLVAPQGWYHDPRGSGRLRYWDGAWWTEHTSPTAA